MRASSISEPARELRLGLCFAADGIDIPSARAFILEYIWSDVYLSRYGPLGGDNRYCGPQYRSRGPESPGQHPFLPGQGTGRERPGSGLAVARSPVRTLAVTAA